MTPCARLPTRKQKRRPTDQLSIPVLETSAKTAAGVEDAFLAMARQIKERYVSMSAHFTIGPLAHVSHNQASRHT